MTGEPATMTDMANPKHAASADKSSAKVAAWSVLITMGSASAILQMWHATHFGHMPDILAVLEGLAPVGAAMGLSEVGARFDGGKTFRILAFGVMAGAMVLSADAIAAVLRPSEPAGTLGVAMSWLFGLVLDAAALTCLWVLLTERGRRKATANADEAFNTEQEVAAAVAETEARVRAEAAGQITDLTTRVMELQGQISALKQRRTSGGKRPRTSGVNKRPASPPNKTAVSPLNKADASGGETAVPEDVDTQAEALRILASEPDISGSELGRRLGKTQRYGCMLKNSLTADAPPTGEQPRIDVEEPSDERS
jgi:hypothetical protein